MSPNTRSRAPRRVRVTTAATLALLVSGLAGCSGDSETDVAEETTSPSPTASSEPSVSTSPSATPTPPDPKLPREPAAKDTEAGRQAYAEFVVDRWSYALATNDASAVTDLSPEGALCQGCPELRAELRTRVKEGWYVDFPGAEVDEKIRLAPAPEGEPGVTVATATIDIPASTSYFEDGEVRNENKARKGATFEVRMRLDGKRYSLLAFSVS
jgi:hypothetical protein